MVHQKIVQTSQQYTGKEAHQKTTPSFMYTQYTHSPWREMGEQICIAFPTTGPSSARELPYLLETIDERWLQSCQAQTL